MINKTVTLTLGVAEAAVLGLMLKQSLKLAERVAHDDDAALDVRVGAMVALLEGYPILKKVIDILPDKPEEEAEEVESELTETTFPHISVKGLAAILH